MTVEWVEGETGPRNFALKDNGAPFVLTGAVVTLILRGPDGALVATPATVNVTDAANGIVQVLISSASILVATSVKIVKASDKPYLAHFGVAIAGAQYYFPSRPDVWWVYQK